MGNPAAFHIFIRLSALIKKHPDNVPDIQFAAADLIQVSAELIIRASV